MDRRKSATLISGTGFEHGKPLHASRAVGASHIGPIYETTPWHQDVPAGSNPVARRAWIHHAATSEMCSYSR